MRSITAYTDYKSPYAYLAKDLTYEVERDLGVRIEWLPYVLDIPSFLGAARVDAEGRVLEENRNPHQWRRVRYSYMDCRRQASKRGLVIRGPQKIWDSTLAAAGITRLLVEGGPILASSLWKLDLIDELAVLRGQTTIGADGIAPLEDLPSAWLEAPPGFQPLAEQVLGGDVLYRFVRD